jgi:hypothetical protein
MNTTAKNILFSIVVVLIFFGSLESAQRIRYAVRYKSPIWLYYGTSRFYNSYDPTSRYADGDAERKKGFAEKGKLISSMDGINVFHYSYDTKRDGSGNVLYRKHVPGDYILTAGAGMHINSTGLRGPEIAAPKSRPRILMLGGSSTLGAYNNDDKTYPYLTQKMMLGRYGKDVEVVNGGIGGANARELYNLLVDNFEKISPDIITVYSGYNNWNARSREGTGLRSAIFRIKEFLMDRSLLFCTINEKICLLKKRSCDEVWFNPGVAESILSDKKIWSDFRTNLEKICEFAHRHNVKVVMMTQPLNLAEKNPPSFWEDKKCWGRHYAMSNSIIKDVASRCGAECIDLAEIVDSRYGDDKKDIFMDIVHLTDKGNETLAGYISERLSADIDKMNTNPRS